MAWLVGITRPLDCFSPGQPQPDNDARAFGSPVIGYAWAFPRLERRSTRPLCNLMVRVVESDLGRQVEPRLSTQNALHSNVLLWRLCGPSRDVAATAFALYAIDLPGIGVEKCHARSLP